MSNRFIHGAVARRHRGAITSYAADGYLKEIFRGKDSPPASSGLPALMGDYVSAPFNRVRQALAMVGWLQEQKDHPNYRRADTFQLMQYRHEKAELKGRLWGSFRHDGVGNSGYVHLVCRTPDRQAPKAEIGPYVPQVDLHEVINQEAWDEEIEELFDLFTPFETV